MNLISLFFLFSFPEIEETLPNSPFVYPGKNKREVILVDASNSPLLLQAKKEFFAKLKPDFSEAKIFVTLIDYLREELFDLSKCSEHNIVFLLGDTRSEPEVPIDLFIEKKTGVCRHMALLTTYFIQELIKENLLDGEVFLIREELPFGRHAWTLFISETGAWHIDAYWGCLENGKTDAGFLNLCKKYSKRVMERQKLRWNND